MGLKRAKFRILLEGSVAFQSEVASRGAAIVRDHSISDNVGRFREIDFPVGILDGIVDFGR